MKDNSSSSGSKQSVQITKKPSLSDDEDEDERQKLHHESDKYGPSHIRPTDSTDEKTDKAVNTFVNVFSICFYLIIVAGMCFIIYNAITPPIEALRFILIIGSLIHIFWTFFLLPGFPLASFDKISTIVAIILILIGVFLPRILNLFV